MKSRFILSLAVLLVAILSFVSSANYPIHFIVSSPDLIEAGNIQTNLQSAMGTTSSGTSTNITSEAYPSFTSSSKFYMDTSLNREYAIILSNGTKKYIYEEEIIKSKECKNCGGCWDFEESICRDIGYIKDKKYCGNYYIGSFKRTGFINQKIADENCTHDFECRSDICNSGKCEQEKGIITTKIKNSEEIFITTILLEGNKIFYFKGLNENIHSIKIGNEEHPHNLLFDGNESNLSKIINLTENSFLVINEFLLEEDVPKVNLTFYETKKKFDNSTEMIMTLFNENPTNTEASEVQTLSFTEETPKNSLNRFLE